MRKGLTVLIMLISLITKASSSYVSTMGSNSNSGSISSPHKTIGWSGADTIYVEAGTYYDKVVIGHEAVIIGYGAVIDATNGGIVLNKPSTLIGISVKGYDNRTGSGITIQSSGVSLISVGVSGCRNGVLINGTYSKDLTIDSCSLVGNYYGVNISTTKTSGPILDSVSITNSTISDNSRTGIYLERVNNLSISQNYIYGNGYNQEYWFNSGIYLNLKNGDYSNIDIVSNSITGNGSMVGNNKYRSSSIIILADTLDNDISITNNTILSDHNGIRIGSTDATPGSGPEITISNNNFNNKKSVVNLTRNRIVLGCNWFGSSEDSSVSKVIVGDVKYRPFYVRYKPAPGSWYHQSKDILITTIIGSGNVFYGYNVLYNTDTLKSISESGSGKYLYKWSTGEKSKNIIVAPKKTTTYYLEVTDTIGCSVSSVDSFKVNVIDVTCNNGMGGVVTVCEAKLKYPVDEYTKPTWVYTTRCVAKKSVIAMIKPVGRGYLGSCGRDLYKRTISEEVTSVEVYPNPTSDVLNINFPDGGDFVLMDMNGRVVFSGSGSTVVDVSVFASGVYVLSYKTDLDQSVRKVIIK